MQARFLGKNTVLKSVCVRTYIYIEPLPLPAGNTSGSALGLPRYRVRSAPKGAVLSASPGWGPFVRAAIRGRVAVPAGRDSPLRAINKHGWNNKRPRWLRPDSAAGAQSGRARRRCRRPPLRSHRAVPARPPAAAMCLLECD